jgi:hypothetical protein
MEDLEAMGAETNGLDTTCYVLFWYDMEIVAKQ